MIRVTFPTITLPSDRRLFRIHRTLNDPWWFSSGGDGRFDPMGTGLGACYLAERRIGAFIEVFRKPLLLDELDIQERRLFSVALGRPLVLADLLARHGLAVGITASLGANEEFGPSQTLAVAAVRQGLDGVRYLVRHDPAQKLVGVAIFGPQGDPGPADSSWPAPSSQYIPRRLVRTAERVFGYRVVPAP